MREREEKYEMSTNGMIECHGSVWNGTDPIRQNRNILNTLS